MLDFLRDLFAPAAEPAKPKAPDPDYDPHLGYSWHRSDLDEVRSRPIRFRMTDAKVPYQGPPRRGMHG